MHEAACKPFLEYFSATDRLMSIDVSSGAEEPIWDKIHEFFTGLQLQAWRPVDSILVFAMGQLLGHNHIYIVLIQNPSGNAVNIEILAGSYN